MEQSWDQARLARMAQKIVLLHYLNHTPEKPSDNLEQYERERSHAKSNDAKRSLSLRQEQRITEAFAHLAANSDDPRRVMAACIQEGSNGKFLTVRLAVNNKDLEGLLEQLSKITFLLQQTNQSVDDAFLPLLHECIALNHNRILCRFHSKHAVLQCKFKKEKKTRAKWVSHLLDTIKELASSHTSQAQVLQSNTEALQVLHHDLEALSPDEAKSNPGLTILVHMTVICEGIYSGLRVMNLREKILATDLQALRKINRYTTICRELLRYSRYFPVFRSIKVIAVAVPPTPPARVDPDSFVKDVVRGISKSPHETTLTAVAKKDGHSNITDLIVSKASLDAFAHAEMQLLFYFENNLIGPLLPRVICSNKKACFLCNLFFRVDGRFYIPSSHGRLYEKWALPTTLKMQSFSQKMKTKLSTFEQEICKRITLEIQKARKPLQDPHESAIFQSAIQSVMTVSTVRPLQPPIMVEVKADRRDSGVCVEEAAVLPLSEPVDPHDQTTSPLGSQSTSPLQQYLSSVPASSSSGGKQIGTLITNNGFENLLCLQDESPTRKAASSILEPLEPIASSPPIRTPFCSSTSTSLELSSSSTNREPTILQSGIPVFTAMTSRNRFLVVHTPKLHLSLSWDPSHQLSEEQYTAHDEKGKQRQVQSSWVRIEWMSRDAAAQISHDQIDGRIVDVRLLTEGLDVTEELGQKSRSGIYMRHGSDLVHISIESFK